MGKAKTGRRDESMSKPKLTQAMRKVLERMEKCVVFCNEKGEIWWGDTGKNLQHNEMVAIDHLSKKGLTDDPDMLYVSKITPAGRRALKEGG